MKAPLLRKNEKGKYWGVIQKEECVIWVHDAVGSIPATPIKYFRKEVDMPKNENRVILNDDEIELLSACLFKIKMDLSRLYWNKNQVEMNSPFENTGEHYKNKIFEVNAYDWGDDDNKKPNFKYKSLEVWWYKHSGRGLYATIDKKDNTKKFYSKMLTNCYKAIEEDFK